MSEGETLPRVCSVAGCERLLRARGLCTTHYAYQRRHGTLSVVIPRGTPEERFWRYVEQVGDCWEWQGARAPDTSHGRFSLSTGLQVGAHRFAYEQMVGSIPDGLVLDHLCQNPPCVNPDHLDPVPHGVNSLRANGAPAINARKTHCIHGHAFTPENTYVAPSGWRMCRTCAREREELRTARKLRGPCVECGEWTGRSRICRKCEKRQVAS